MKRVIYLGIFGNGYTAKENCNSEFTLEEDLKGFYDNSKSARNIIMGKNTYIEVSGYGCSTFPICWIA